MDQTRSRETLISTFEDKKLPTDAVECGTPFAPLGWALLTWRSSRRVISNWLLARSPSYATHSGPKIWFYTKTHLTVFSLPRVVWSRIPATLRRVASRLACRKAVMGPAEAADPDRTLNTITWPFSSRGTSGHLHCCVAADEEPVRLGREA
ncbi:hypothetical protein LZ30DRAFT_23979 [Colletotrichum cereale]|nr:hypothetical protein LZ30DRAFT_23979 [Colletotrichum cereale]